jgi:hypothetical protein
MNCSSCKISFSKKLHNNNVVKSYNDMGSAAQSHNNISNSGEFHNNIKDTGEFYNTNDKIEPNECDLCSLNTCKNCINIVHDDFYVPILVCQYCVNNVDTYIADRFEDYLYKCKEDNAIPLPFFQWLKLPYQNNLKIVRKEYRRQMKEKEATYRAIKI